MSISTKIVVDTNILFMALYNPNRKAGRIIQLAIDKKITLFSPIPVKSELDNALKKKFHKLSKGKIEFIIEALPVNWIEKEIYESFMEKTTVKKEPDKDVEALSLVLNCGILTADTDFNNVKNRVDIDDVLKQLEEN